MADSVRLIFATIFASEPKGGVCVNIVVSISAGLSFVKGLVLEMPQRQEMWYTTQTSMEKSIAELTAKIRADFGRSGGLARAAKLTKVEQSAIGSKAVRARWRKYRAAKKIAREDIKRIMDQILKRT